MGTVFAKENNLNNIHTDSDIFQPTYQARKHKDIELKTVPVKVEKIHIDGLDRTKNDLLQDKVSPLFEASNFEDMVKTAYDVKSQLDKLGIFKQVTILIDTHQGSKASKKGYEVTFEVEEVRPIAGGISTLVGTNEGTVLFGIRLPNIFGRGEKLSAEYQHGTTKNMGCNFAFHKPVGGDPDKMFSTNVYQNYGEFPWSGYKGTDRGISADFVMPGYLGAHVIRLEGVWREIGCLSNMTSFAVREQAGHSLKTSLQHIFLRDRRDNKILPNNGSMMKLTQELAGLGIGNAKFIKQEAEMQVNKLLFLDTVVQLSLSAGHIKSLQEDKTMSVSDRLFIGGPLTLRGFNMKGIGPSSDGASLGGDTYWQSGLHLYTPLPFRPGTGGIGDYFRTHFFLNAGNLFNLQPNGTLADLYHQLAGTIRVSYGAGVVLRMGGIARLELNYCIPVKVQHGDSVNKGLQFGIGLHFL